MLGGRSYQFKDEKEIYTFDGGPSWYWFPEIYDKIFQRYGYERKYFYNLTRLDPAYRIIM
jgi:phytoene desaturase